MILSKGTGLGINLEVNSSCIGFYRGISHIDPIQFNLIINDKLDNSVLLGFNELTSRQKDKIVNDGAILRQSGSFTLPICELLKDNPNWYLTPFNPFVCLDATTKTLYSLAITIDALNMSGKAPIDYRVVALCLRMNSDLGAEIVSVDSDYDKITFYGMIDELHSTFVGTGYTLRFIISSGIDEDGRNFIIVNPNRLKL